MENNLLLSLLKNKLVETEQEAAKLREVAVKAQIEASIMEALAEKMVYYRTKRKQHSGGSGQQVIRLTVLVCLMKLCVGRIFTIE